MQRLIDANELLTKAFGKRCGLIHTSEINKMPTVDAVPVVRCRDCAKAEADTIFREYWCDGKKVPPSHYCGYGERRDV